MPFLKSVQNYTGGLLRRVNRLVNQLSLRGEREAKTAPAGIATQYPGTDFEIDRLDSVRKRCFEAGDLDGEADALSQIANKLVKASSPERHRVVGCLSDIETLLRKTSGAATVPLLRLSGIGIRLRQKIEPTPAGADVSGIASAHSALVDALKHPADPKFLAIAGRRFMEMGQYAVARGCFNGFDSLGGADGGGTSFLLGQCLLQLHQFDEASQVFVRAVKEGYPALAVTAFQARALFETGDAKGALEQVGVVLENLELSDTDIGALKEEMDPARRAFAVAMLIVAARACEGLGDFANMLKHADNALLVDRTSDDARYWKIRCGLHGTAPLEPHVVDDLSSQTDARWNRLRAALRLHATQSAGSVAAIVGILKGDEGDIDESEKLLFLSLAQRAMTPSILLQADLLAQRREICEQIRSTLRDPVGWLATNVAIDCLVRTHEYTLAWKELNRKEGLTGELDHRLFEIASLLVACEIDTPKALPSVEAARCCLLRLVDRHVETPQSPNPGAEYDLAIHLEDSLVRLIPGLSSTIAGLMLVSRAISTSEECTEQLSGLLDDPVSPRWLKWIALRLYLLRGGAMHADLTEVNDFALAWSAEQWWFLFGEGISARPAVVNNSRRCLNLLQVPAVLDQVRAARLGDRSALPDTFASQEYQSRSNLGDIGEKAFDRELELEIAFLLARNRLRQQGAACAPQFEALLERLQQLPLVTSLMWLPVLVYWHGVSLLQSEPRQAHAALSGLAAGGPQSLQARAQLALLAVGLNNLEAANAHLSGVAPSFPASAYAHSLIHARQGNAIAAQTILESFETDFAESLSPYRAAAQRLLAALHERSGRLDEAERLYRKIIELNPEDDVALARLGRLLVKKVYEASRKGKSSSSTDSLQVILRQASSRSEWCHPYQALHQLLTVSETEVVEVASKCASTGSLPVTAATLSQIVARRLLQTGRSEDAYRFLEAADARDRPDWQLRTWLILRAWHLLKNIWSPEIQTTGDPVDDALRDLSGELPDTDDDRNAKGTSESPLRSGSGNETPSRLPALANCLDDFDSLMERDPCELLQRWHCLVAYASTLTEQREGKSQPEGCESLASWPISHLPKLFSRDEKERIAAAGLIAGIVDSPDFNWTDTQRWLLRALCAAARKHDDGYLAAYEMLEPSLDELPIDGTALWLRAASIRFSRKDWIALLDKPLPARVESLADPHVRFLLGLAYARATVDDAAREDTRRASQRARQAQSTLEVLIERT